jgi:hypothetical protein
VRNATIFAVDVKPMQVGITPPMENLNRVMKVGNAVVAPQEQSPPNHRANAAQYDLELVNAQHLEAGMELHCIATDCAAKRFPQFGGRTSTRFSMLSVTWVIGSNGTENSAKAFSFLNT